MRLLITIGWLIWGPVIYAQSGLVVTRIGMEDGVGLNSDNVFCTYQDARGFVWVGTVNGLQRFDGSKFLGYGTSKPLPGQLPISSLTEIFGGRGAELWLHFPLRNEVGVYNTATLTYRAVPIRAKGAIPVRHARKLKVDSHGNRYLCIWKYGILQYSATEDAFIDNNPFRLPPGWIPSIYFCEDTLAKRFWLPCPDSGLALHDVASGQTYTRQHNPIGHPILASKQLKQHPWEMFIDSKRRYWIFSWDTAHHKLCYNEQGQVLNDSAGLRELSGYQELRFFMETRSGGLWMYGVNCLYWYDKLKGRMEFLRGSGSGGGGNLRYGDVRHIMQDRDGSLWLSTDNGLYFTTEESGNRNVVNIKFANKESDHAINDLIQLKTGEYWLATWGTGIIALTDRLQRYEANIYRDMPPMHRFRQNAYKQLWALHQQPDGKVWIGCQAGAYMIYEPAAQRTAFLQCEAADGATLRYITADAKGHVWVGTQRGHLIQYDGQRFAVRQQLGTIVRKINFDEAGLMWVATEGNGLYCISADGQTILRHYTAGGQGLFQNMVYDIDVLDRHTIVCAAGALNMIDKRTGKVKWFTVEDGLPSNSVMRIRKDRAGYLWMVTQNGLCRYNPLNSRFTAYGSKDGVVMAQEATEADYLCNENYVMFAGGSALLFFKPEAFDQQVQPYDVTITDFKLQQRFLAVDSLLGLPGITLSANENSLSIYFTSLSYLQREKLTYFYQLEGLDKTWIKADRQGLVTYNLLPPGNYIFKIYAETIDGKRTAHVTTLPIRIRPPFWRTGWFLSTLLMLITLVAYMMHRLRINRILAVEAIRNRVARDLHDDMGSTLSTINILSAMAKAKLSSDVIKTNEYISKISDNSQRMMEAMDDIVWAIKPTNDSMHKVVARMREFATNVMEAKDIELDFKAEEAVSDVNIDMEARRDFFLVFKEAVNNAAKYARCTQVAIAVKTAQKKLYLTVQDNGVGFDVKQADSGNGLGNMQKRADALGGQLRIESMAGQGTVVTLMIPIN